jgi:ParD-like antitoxin of type II bacterial toxin-antitoxin system
MTHTTPIRIDDELYASAKLVGRLMHRSAAQQLAHWARLGREIEASEGVSHRSIALVVAGSQDYDLLSPQEQAVVRAEWAEQMDARREGLDLAASFAESGKPYVGLDAEGRVVRHAVDGTVLEVMAPVGTTTDS